MVVSTCVYRYVFGAEIITIGDSGTAAVSRRLEDPGQIGKAMDFGGGCQPRLRMDAVATRSWFLQCERRVVLFPQAGQCCCLSAMCPVGKGRVSARRLPDKGVYCLSLRKGPNYRACEIPRTYTRPSTGQMQCWCDQSSEDASSREMPVSNEGGATLGRAVPRPGLALYIDCVRAPGGICSPAAGGFEDCIRLYCGSSIRVLPFSRSTLSTL